MKKMIRLLAVSAAIALAAAPLSLQAHCDTLEGPVVTAARTALKAGDLNPVLIWIQPKDEPAIRTAFTQTLAVRKQSKEAGALADQWFFETVVRIHRAGEGAPYTGLKSGDPTEPGIEAADRALESGQVNDVLAASALPLQEKLKAKFARVTELKAHAGHSIEAGREYVAAYVDYIHFAERLAVLAANDPATEHAAHVH